MARRRVTATVRCAKPGCREVTHFEYDSQRERADAERYRQRCPWRCFRHSDEDAVLSPTNPERTATLTAVKVDYGAGPLPGLYWRAEGGRATSGLLSGPGFKAIASDLPEGARLIVTARIELPEADRRLLVALGTAGCCICDPDRCADDDTGQHCADRSCGWCLHGCPASDDQPCCQDGAADRG